MGGRKLAFWVAVGGVSILANFFLELASDHLPAGGFQELVAYIHRGPSRA